MASEAGAPKVNPVGAEEPKTTLPTVGLWGAPNVKVEALALSSASSAGFGAGRPPDLACSISFSTSSTALSTMALFFAKNAAGHFFGGAGFSS